MKKESLVIVNQHVTVNMFLNLVQTARHVSEVGLRKKNILILNIFLFSILGNNFCVLS
jgi:hypothetical protein